MAVDLTAGCLPGWNQVQTLVHHVASSIRYTPGSGSALRSAREVNGSNEGVCRDLAHLTDLVTTQIQTIPGIRSTETLVIGKIYKLSFFWSPDETGN